MSTFYLKTMRPAIAERVAAICADKMPVDVLDLTQELTLVRMIADDVGEQYALAHEIEDPAKQQSARVAMGMAMADMLDKVKSMCEAAGRMEEVKIKTQGAFASVMAAIITSVVHAAWEVWGDSYEVKKFEEKIREKLEARNVPVGADGTEITPDMDVAAMDATIPRLEESNGEPHEEP